MTTKDYSLKEAREISLDYEKLTGKKGRMTYFFFKEGEALNNECEWMINEIDKADAAKFYRELSKIQDEENPYS